MDKAAQNKLVGMICQLTEKVNNYEGGDNVGRAGLTRRHARTAGGMRLALRVGMLAQREGCGWPCA
jgi:hypothetical protein